MCLSCSRHRSPARDLPQGTALCASPRLRPPPTLRGRAGEIRTVQWREVGGRASRPSPKLSGTQVLPQDQTARTDPWGRRPAEDVVAVSTGVPHQIRSLLARLPWAGHLTPLCPSPPSRHNNSAHLTTWLQVLDETEAIKCLAS